MATVALPMSQDNLVAADIVRVMARKGEPRAHTTELEFSCVVEAPAERVWGEVTHFAGINGELMPLLRMTSPRAWADRTIEDAEPGQRLFRSWLLLFGVIPIDYDDIGIAEIGPGCRFLERSRMMSAALWEHEREIVDVGANACRVTDRLRLIPRWRPMGLVLRWFVPRIFTHRHNRLQQRYAVTRSG